MGAGAYISVQNYSSSPVTVNIPSTSVNNMSDGTDVTLLNGTLPAGQSTAANPNFYIESSGAGESTFTVNITDENGNQLASVAFSEDDYAYGQTTTQNSPGPIMVQLCNQNSSSSLNQAWISITVLPIPFDPGNWIGQTPGLSFIPLAQLCLPGSHDAGTYVVTNAQTGNITDGVIACVSTQTAGIQGQLEAGTRYFDIRPGAIAINEADPLSTKLFHIHSPHTDSTVIMYECAPFADMMTDISNFAASHANEIVIVNLNHFSTATTGPVTYDSVSMDSLTCIAQIACQQAYTALQGQMLPNSINFAKSVQDIRASNVGNIILMFDCTVTPSGPSLGPNNVYVQGASDYFFWLPQSGENGPLYNWGTYADSDNIGSTYVLLQANIPNGSNTSTSCLNLLQCQCTAQTADCVADGLDAFDPPYSNAAMASVMNPLAMQLLSGTLNPPGAASFLKYGNIYLMDAVYVGTTYLALGNNIITGRALAKSNA